MSAREVRESLIELELAIGPKNGRICKSEEMDGACTQRPRSKNVGGFVVYTDTVKLEPWLEQ